MATMVQLANSSRTVDWMRASVSTSTLAVASSRTRICSGRRRTDFHRRGSDQSRAAKRGTLLATPPRDSTATMQIDIMAAHHRPH